jgi:hypothetical protein
MFDCEAVKQAGAGKAREVFTVRVRSEDEATSGYQLYGLVWVAFYFAILVDLALLCSFLLENRE